MGTRLGLITVLVFAVVATTASAADDRIRPPSADAVVRQGPPISGPRDVAIIKVKYANTAAPTSTNTDFTNVMSAVSAFYQEQSSDQTSMSLSTSNIYSITLGQSFPADCTSYAGLHAMYDAAKAAPGFNPSGFEHIMIVFRNPGTSCGYSGSADMPGNLVWIDEANTGVHEYTFAHELGHNLGLDHANAADCVSCGSQEYGDPYDTMGLPIDAGGFYSGLRNFSGYERTNAGLEPVAESVASSSGDYSLSPLSLSSGVRRITVPRGGTSAFSIEIRGASGIDASIDPQATNGILVRLVKNTGSGERKTHLIDSHPGGNRLDSPFAPGTGFADSQTGIKITNLGTSLGQTTVRVLIPPPAPIVPTGSITKPKFKNGKAKIPKNGKITYSFPGAGKLVFKLGGKSKTFKKGTATYTIPKPYRKKKSGTLKITASGGSLTKAYVKTYKLKKGTIKG